MKRPTDDAFIITDLRSKVDLGPSRLRHQARVPVSCPHAVHIQEITMSQSAPSSSSTTTPDASAPDSLANTKAEASSSSTPTSGSSREVARTSQNDAGSALQTEHGKTTIADTVVAKIAGIAVREVHGVHSLGGGTARAVGLLRERIPGAKTNHSQGVSVEVGQRQAAVDVQLVADYGVSIADLAEGIRRNVISAVEGMTGLEVTEVNIEVQDVFVESDDSSDDSTEDESQDEREPRVQ